MMVLRRTHPMEDLNASDHLPLTICRSYDSCSGMQDERVCTFRQPRIDWEKAQKSDALDMFTPMVRSILALLLIDIAELMNGENELVAGLLTHAAEKCFLVCNQGRRLGAQNRAVCVA